MLIEFGSHLDNKDNEGRTPLFWASQNGYFEMYFIKKIQIKCISGLGKEDVARVLIQSGCNVNEKVPNGNSPISIATIFGEIYINMFTDKF